MGRYPGGTYQELGLLLLTHGSTGWSTGQETRQETRGEMVDRITGPGVFAVSVRFVPVKAIILCNQFHARQSRTRRRTEDFGTSSYDSTRTRRRSEVRPDLRPVCITHVAHRPNSHGSNTLLLSAFSGEVKHRMHNLTWHRMGFRFIICIVMR